MYIDNLIHWYFKLRFSTLFSTFAVEKFKAYYNDISVFILNNYEVSKA